MNRSRIPGLVDRITVEDPAEIIALNSDPRIDREFRPRWPLLNFLTLRRSLAVLSFAGHRFPTMISRHSAPRAAAQAKLGARLDQQAATMKDGPRELEDLAAWLRGERPDAQLGIFVQQIVGRLFSPHFVATEKSWRAAKILVAAPRSTSWPTTLAWLVTGKMRRAKRILAAMVDGDLSAVNGIGIAAHNIVHTLEQMKVLFADPAQRAAHSPEDAVRQSLAAPVSLFRQPVAAGEIKGCPFSKNSLFVLMIGKASKLPGGESLVFMDDGWSACPASSWVPALLQGAWKRAAAALRIEVKTHC